MSDGVVPLTLILGFGFILFAGSRLGAGSHQAFAGLFAARGGRDWPTGIQEGDAPRFAVRHLDGLRPGSPAVITTGVTTIDTDEAPRAELFDLGSRHIA